MEQKPVSLTWSQQIHCGVFCALFYYFLFINKISFSYMNHPDNWLKLRDTMARSWVLLPFHLKSNLKQALWARKSCIKFEAKETRDIVRKLSFYLKWDWDSQIAMMLDRNQYVPKWCGHMWPKGLQLNKLEYPSPKNAPF